MAIHSQDFSSMEEQKKYYRTYVPGQYSLSEKLMFGGLLALIPGTLLILFVKMLYDAIVITFYAN